MLVGQRALITGDTLFIDSCGRTDLQESNPEHMRQSLARLAKLPLDCLVFPGHNYAAATQSSIQRERERNFAMRGAMMGGDGLRPSSISAGNEVLLPDYLQAARNALLLHRHE